MSARNVYLIDLGTGTDRNLLPLSIGLVASYARSFRDLDAAYDFHLRFLRADPTEMANDLEKPFVVGLACYVWNLRATLAVARAIRNRHPQAIIVAGGYSVPKAPDRIRQLFAEQPIDVLVHGEGEYTFTDLLTRLLVDRDLAQVQGITFRTLDSPAGFITTPRRDRVDQLNTIPSPFLNGVFDNLMTRYGSAVTGAVWETNRGCPFSCSFCDWGNSDSSKVKKFEIDRLHAEIDWMSRNKIYYIYGADANFGIFYDRDMEIAGHIADSCQQTGFPRYFMINWTKNSHERIVAIADRLTAGGVLTTVTLAMQSFNPTTLDAIKRRNIKQDSLLKLKRAFHDRDLPTYTEVILGLPQEDYFTFRLGLDEAMTPRLSDHFVIYLCTLLENTEMSSPEYRAKYGLESRFCVIGMSRRHFEKDEDQDREIEEFVVGTKTLPVSEWRRAYLYGYFATVLFNHRVAFFVMQYLQNEFGDAHSDFIDFCLEELDASPLSLPRLSKGYQHIAHQSQLILDGVGSMSGPEGLEDVCFTPHEGALAVLLYDPDTLYGDIGRLVEKYCAKKGYVIDGPVLNEILHYQKIRMPTWAEGLAGEHIFRTSVPRYFDAVVKGEDPAPIGREHLVLAVTPVVAPGKYAEFAVRLVRGGHTVLLNEVKILDRKQALPLSATAA